MTHRTDDELEIRVAERAEWREAVELAMSETSAELLTDKVDEVLRQAEAGQQSLDGMFVALQNRQIVATLWTIPSPGRTALVAPAVFRDEVVERIVDQLFRFMLKWLDENRIALGQTILEPGDVDSESRFARHGFEYIAELHYLYCSPVRFPVAAPALDLELRPFEEAATEDLIAIIEDTYVDSLDCPALNGTRGWDDILQGYRNTGDSGSSLWRIAYRDEKPAGCTLITRHESLGQLELIYMGIVPEMRGHDLGRRLVNQVLWMAKQQQQRGVVLAVDLDNRPAFRIYEELGFQTWDRRRLFLNSREAPETKAG